MTPPKSDPYALLKWVLDQQAKRADEGRVDLETLERQLREREEKLAELAKQREKERKR